MCITASGGVVVAVASPKVAREGVSSFAVKDRALTSVSVYATTNNNNIIIIIAFFFFFFTTTTIIIIIIAFAFAFAATAMTGAVRNE